MISEVSSSIKRKAFRVLYNLVIDDTDQFVLLLKQVNFCSTINNCLKEGSFLSSSKQSSSFRLMVIGFYRVALQTANDQKYSYLIPVQILNNLLKIGQYKAVERDSIILEALLLELDAIEGE